VPASDRRCVQIARKNPVKYFVRDCVGAQKICGTSFVPNSVWIVPDSVWTEFTDGTTLVPSRVNRRSKDK
jgi:hypothetical protein